MLWPQELGFPSRCSSSEGGTPHGHRHHFMFWLCKPLNSCLAALGHWKRLFFHPPLQSVSSGLCDMRALLKAEECFVFFKFRIIIPRGSHSHALCCHCVFYLANLQFCWDIYGLVAWQYSIRERLVIENVEYNKGIVFSKGNPDDGWVSFEFTADVWGGFSPAELRGRGQ